MSDVANKVSPAFGLKCGVDGIFDIGALFNVGLDGGIAIKNKEGNVQRHMLSVSSALGNFTKIFDTLFKAGYTFQYFFKEPLFVAASAGYQHTKGYHMGNASLAGGLFHEFGTGAFSGTNVNFSIGYGLDIATGDGADRDITGNPVTDQSVFHEFLMSVGINY